MGVSLIGTFSANPGDPVTLTGVQVGDLLLARLVWDGVAPGGGVGHGDFDKSAWNFIGSNEGAFNFVTLTKFAAAGDLPAITIAVINPTFYGLVVIQAFRHTVPNFEGLAGSIPLSGAGVWPGWDSEPATPNPVPIIEVLSAVQPVEPLHLSVASQLMNGGMVSVCVGYGYTTAATPSWAAAGTGGVLNSVVHGTGGVSAALACFPISGTTTPDFTCTLGVGTGVRGSNLVSSFSWDGVVVGVAPLVLAKPNQIPPQLVFQLAALNEGFDRDFRPGLSFAATPWGQIAPVTHDDTKPTGLKIHTNPEFCRSSYYEGYYFFPSTVTAAGDAVGFLTHETGGGLDPTADPPLDEETSAAVRVPGGYTTPVLLGSAYPRFDVPDASKWHAIGYQDGRIFTIESNPFPYFVGHWRDPITGAITATVDPRPELDNLVANDVFLEGFAPNPNDANGLFIAKDVIALMGSGGGNVSRWFLWDLTTNTITKVGDVEEWVAGMPAVGSAFGAEGNLAWSPGQNALIYYGYVSTNGFAPDGTRPPGSQFNPGLPDHEVHVLVVLDATTFEVRSRSLGPSFYSWYANGFSQRQFWVEPGFTADNTTAFLGLNPRGPVVDQLNDRYVYIARMTDSPIAAYTVPAIRTWSVPSYTGTAPHHQQRATCMDVWKVDLQNPSAQAVMVASLQHPDPLLWVNGGDVDHETWYYIGGMQAGWLFEAPNLSGALGPQLVDFWRPRA